MIAPAPSTPLGIDVAAQIAHRYELAARMDRAKNMLETMPTRRLLRSHLDRSIRASEVPLRDNLDELLACLSVLHLSGLDTEAVFREMGTSVDDVLDLLEQNDVCRFYEAYYPYAPPILLRESIGGRGGASYRERLSDERHQNGWISAFDRFMILDAAFNTPGPLYRFLAVIDDYTFDGFGLAHMRMALRDRKTMQRFLGSKSGRTLMEGLQDFLVFSEELDEYLASIPRFPLFRGLVWLNFSYWYGAGGDRMRRVAKWVIRTLDAVSADRGLPDGSDFERTLALKEMMERLTAFDDYPRELLQECWEPLQRWRHHVMEKNQFPSIFPPHDQTRR